MKKTIDEIVFEMQRNHWYVAFLVILAISSALLLLYEVAFAGEGDIKIIQRIDIAIAYVFLTDFVVGIIFSKKHGGKMAYFKANWLNIFSSIPIHSEVVRAMRLIRLIRALRVVRAGANIWDARNIKKSRYI